MLAKTSLPMDALGGIPLSGCHSRLCQKGVLAMHIVERCRAQLCRDAIKAREPHLKMLAPCHPEQLAAERKPDDNRQANLARINPQRAKWKAKKQPANRTRQETVLTKTSVGPIISHPAFRILTIALSRLMTAKRLAWLCHLFVARELQLIVEDRARRHTVTPPRPLDEICDLLVGRLAENRRWQIFRLKSREGHEAGVLEREEEKEGALTTLGFEHQSGVYTIIPVGAHHSRPWLYWICPVCWHLNWDILQPLDLFRRCSLAGFRFGPQRQCDANRLKQKSKTDKTRMLVFSKRSRKHMHSHVQ